MRQRCGDGEGVNFVFLNLRVGLPQILKAVNFEEGALLPFSNEGFKAQDKGFHEQVKSGH